MPLTFAQIQQFKIDGYLVLPGLLNNEDVEHLRLLTEQHSLSRIEPLELEAELKYPGAPASVDSKGGETYAAF